MLVLARFLILMAVVALIAGMSRGNLLLMVVSLVGIGAGVKLLLISHGDE